MTTYLRCTRWHVTCSDRCSSGCWTLVYCRKPIEQLCHQIIAALAFDEVSLDSLLSAACLVSGVGDRVGTESYFECSEAAGLYLCSSAPHQRVVPYFILRASIGSSLQIEDHVHNMPDLLAWQKEERESANHCMSECCQRSGRELGICEVEAGYCSYCTILEVHNNLRPAFKCEVALRAYLKPGHSSSLGNSPPF